MSTYIGSLRGSRGRCIDLYDNKCVITTDVTLGSILTNNALDGQKTLFYIDVVGVQFKESGLTIGYLQLETASMQMNNQSSNMFSENTFTFEENTTVSNRVMRLVHQFVIDTLEGYKYHFTPDKGSLAEMVLAMKEEGHKVNADVLQEINSLKKQQAEQKEKEEQDELRRLQEEKERSLQMMRQKIEEKGSQGPLIVFLENASKCNRISEVKSLWESLDIAATLPGEEITGKINKAAMVERMYGVNLNSLKRLLADISDMISGN